MARQNLSIRQDGKRSASKPEIAVSLDIHSFKRRPDQISKLLGLTPTRTWSHGDAIPKTILKRKSNHWILDAPCERTAPLSEQVDSLLEQVFPIAEKFASLPKEAKVQLFCVVYDHERSVVLGFSEQAIAKIAALGAEINIDYYDLSGAD
jgi:hypothetical protein